MPTSVWSLLSRHKSTRSFITTNWWLNKSENSKRPDRFARTFVTTTLWFCLEIRENPKRLLPSTPERLNQRTTLNVLPPTQFSCGTQSHVFKFSPTQFSTEARAVYVTHRLHCLSNNDKKVLRQALPLQYFKQANERRTLTLSKTSNAPFPVFFALITILRIFKITCF